MCGSYIERWSYVYAIDFLAPPSLRKKVGKVGVTIEIKFIVVVPTAFLLMKISKEANWPSGGVHFDFLV